jgi:hypothetical protein
MAIRQIICSSGTPRSRPMRSAFGKAPSELGWGFCRGPGISPSVRIAMEGRRKNRFMVASLP